MTGTGGLQRVPKDVLSDFRIPLPPLEVQREIMAEIEKYQAKIETFKKEIIDQNTKIEGAIKRVWGEE